VATSTETDEVWATMRKTHQGREGFQIARFNGVKKLPHNRWEEDISQPVGAYYYMAMDGEGQPAFIGYSQPRSIYHKRHGKWHEIRGCSNDLTFAPDGTLYRIGCDWHIYRYEDEHWIKFSKMKARRIAAGLDGLWIIDNNWKPFKYNVETNEFESRGTIKANFVVVGLEG